MLVDEHKHAQPTRKQQQQQLHENAIVPQRGDVSISAEDAYNSYNLWRNASSLWQYYTFGHLGFICFLNINSHLVLELLALRGLLEDILAF